MISGYQTIELVRDHLGALQREREQHAKAGDLHKAERINAEIEVFKSEFERMQGELEEKIKRENDARLKAAGIA